jgi:hypothetical protein
VMSSGVLLRQTGARGATDADIEQHRDHRAQHDAEVQQPLDDNVGV